MKLVSANLSELNLHEYTLLIVDDNPINLGVISDYLEGCGFRILVARNGESVFKKIQYIQPDIILLDVMMPGIDGFETCRRLKANPITQEIPVIFMTALTETEDKVKGFEVGGVDYVTKPIQQEEVLARVMTHLKIRNLMRELQQANAALAKRALQLEASHQVGQQLTSILDLDSLLLEVIRLIQAKFGYYSVSIWLLTDQSASVALQVGTVCEAQLLPTPSLSIPLATNQSIIASVCRSGQAYLANDVSLDDQYLASEIFPETRSELALPLRLGEEMIGVLDIKSDQPATFDDEDKTVFQTLANQIAIAIRNARLYEMEKKLNADKDKFFSIISHDLRGPFHNVLGNAQLMLEMMERLSKQDIKEMTYSIYNGAKAAYGLLENLLLWSRLQRGRMEYQPNRLKLSSLAQETVELLGEIAAQKNIRLSHTIEANLYIYADLHMMSTVIRNLTNNALKFTPSGGTVILSAQPGRGLENGADAPETSPDFVTVLVSDTGVGIKPEDVDELFGSGVYYSTPGTNKEYGTGLGLILCKEMVEQNGGRIWIENQVGQGTRVQFTVPTQP